MIPILMLKRDQASKIQETCLGESVRGFKSAVEENPVVQKALDLFGGER